MTFQLGAALLDACVLAILSGQDEYGYALTQRVKEVVILSESTLYPVLRRLQKEELLTAYDSQFNGRNRRYYAISEVGRERLSEYVKEWGTYKKNLDMILLGGMADEQG